eukprot:3635203-Rhodomonas_salina.1
MEGRTVTEEGVRFSTIRYLSTAGTWHRRSHTRYLRTAVAAYAIAVPTRHVRGSLSTADM